MRSVSSQSNCFFEIGFVRYLNQVIVLSAGVQLTVLLHLLTCTNHSCMKLLTAPLETSADGILLKKACHS